MRRSPRFAARLRVIAVLVPLTSTAVAAQTLLVGNKSDHTVDVVDLASGRSVATLPTGVGPHEIAVSADGGTAVISNYGTRDEPGSSLTVVDVDARQVVRTIELGEHTRPHGLVWLDGTRLAVTTEGSRHLLVVDARAGTIERAIATAQEVSHMVAVSAATARAFVANIGSGTVTAIDLASGEKLGDVATGAGAEGIAATPDGAEIWVTNREADTLSIIDATTLTVTASLACPAFPIRVAITPDGTLALVSAARSGEVVAIDTGSHAELARSRLDLRALPESTKRLFGDRFGDSPVPVGLVIAPDGRTAWVAATQADVVVAIEPRTLEVKGVIEAGREPDGMAYSPR
jgi:YVTN family beta-propeller protein